MNNNPIFLNYILTILITAISVIHSSASDLTEILPLTDKIIMLRFDDGYIKHYNYHQTGEACVTYNYPLDTTLAADPASYIIYSPDDPAYFSPNTPTFVGRKSKGHDFSRKCLWTGSICDNDYISEHFLYLELPHPMQDGKIYVINTGNLAYNKTADSLVFDVKKVRSEAIHVNQAGYYPGASSKYAYLSHWMGDMGPLNLDPYNGVTFDIIDLSTGISVFSGILVQRLDLETSVQPDLPDQPENRQYFSMSDVWECDFSEFNTPGEYVVSVEKIGCSYPFEISEDIYREAFYHTCRQLYHNRTGIPLEAPYTEWTRPRTGHPDDGYIKFKYSKSRWIDWNGTENGNSVEVLAAVDTSVHLTTWGWYQDAGDWDGYYSHTAIPRYLMTAFELASENFADGDLNIPESSNGIPDILDEAAWLIGYLDRTRGPLGGVAGARIHPDFEEIADGIPSWEDTRNWIISGEDYVTTFTFAGLCAQYAFCLKMTGKNSLADNYFIKAEESFEWANTHFESGDDLYNSRLYAAAWLYKFSGINVYQNIFKNDYNLISSKPYASENRIWAIWAYITTSQSNIDNNQKQACMTIARSMADNDVVDPSSKRSFRVGFNWTYPIMVGQATTPMVMPALVMFKLTGEEKYLTASLTSCDYYLGGNPLNLVWMTGFGDNRVKQVLHLDTWFSNRQEMIPGIIPYGPAYDGWLQNNGPWSSDFALERIYPDQSYWPPHETWFENRYCPPTNEFTVHQNSAPAAAVYGMLCNKWSGSWQPNQLPVIIITSPAGNKEISEGTDVMITVDATDPDGYIRKVEFYNGWHKLGESTQSPFTFKWKNNMPGPYLISAIAFDNKGAYTKAEISTGINNQSSNEENTGFNLYPVPASNELKLEFTIDFPADATVEIFNTNGQLVFREKLSLSGPQQQVIDIALDDHRMFTPGSYICRLTAGSGNNLFKAARLFIMD
jgi:endoglucanase